MIFASKPMKKRSWMRTLPCNEISCIVEGGPPLIPYAELEEVSIATFDAVAHAAVPLPEIERNAITAPLKGEDHAGRI